MTQQHQTIYMRGGLDVVTPANLVPPGTAIAAQNYESEIRGYRRVDGYERFDGHPKPSSASFASLPFENGSSEPLIGDVVTGATSGARAVVLAETQLSEGTFSGGDAVGEFILFDVTGEFSVGERLDVDGSGIAFATASQLQETAETDEEAQTHKFAAIEARRARIGALPGSGPVRGVFALGQEVFGARDSADGSAGMIFRASDNGWLPVSLGRELRFSNGNDAQVQEGDVLTGLTSGATAHIARLYMMDGAWDGSAAGYVTLSNVAGSFQAGETVSTTSGGSFTSVVGDQAITLPPGGRYRSVQYNFFGALDRKRTYVATGAGPAFEFDGSVLCLLRKGFDVSWDMPMFVSVHANHLMLGYQGGSLQYSSTGTPHDTRVITGAGEIAFGETLTGLKSNTRTATVIAGRNKIGYLTGTSILDFNLQYVTEDSGAYADTLQVVSQPYFLDDQGVRSLDAADTFGNWGIGTRTRKVEPLIRSKRENKIPPIGAARVRAKDQYRIYFEDGSGLSLYFGRDETETMPIFLGFKPVLVNSIEDGDGAEIIFAGDDNGMVYQLDMGTSADGEAIEAFIRFSFLHQGRPRQHKRYHRAALEIEDGGSSVTLSFSCDFDFGNPDQPSGVEEQLFFGGGGGFWDQFRWDEFTWDSQVIGEAIFPLNGIGKNVTIALMSEAGIEEPHVLSALTTYYTPRRLTR